MKTFQALEGSSGKLLLQSNCEDVAVRMKELATNKVGFQSIKVPFSVGNISHNKEGQLPKRTIQWISMGGQRAEGEEWSSKSLIPDIGSTETEISCIEKGTPIHRCLLTPK